MGFPLVTQRWATLHERTAMPTSWRPMVAGPYWLDHDVVISSEGGASGRKQFEIHINGEHFANRPRLDEAKEAVEKVYGPLQWNTKRLSKMETDHYHFGPTTEFTSPLTIWVASLPMQAAASLPIQDDGAFDSQASQYPRSGPPGVSYFKGEIDSERWVDCLLWRDASGKLEGILNHFPMDFPPYEEKGNVNVIVRSSSRRQGIGTKLMLEAFHRWNINLSQQTYTPDGAALRDSL